ncbi:MAG: response regulator [Lentisphaeria bacterium]|nr:response regulator [Lentisphaeria bacterium]NQZ70400.1 response regulator [Lentisphaeria bacterium]
MDKHLLFKFKAPILLVEDESINQQVVTNLLEKMGAKVELAENGHIALEMMKSNDYELILMDYQMPLMNGLESTKQIRQYERGKNKHRTIIAMTAHATIDVHKKYLELGMDNFISKPIKFVTLCQNLAIYCEHKEIDPPKRPVKTVLTDENDAVFDLHAALESCDYSIPMLQKVCAEFIEALPEKFKEIDQLIERKEFIQVSQIAHSIIGVSGNVGAVEVFNKAQLLESSMESPRPNVKTFIDMLDSFRRYKERVDTFNWANLTDLLKK